MVFSSNEFLFFCLPLFLVFYFVAPKKYGNAILFLSSLVFYAWEMPPFVLVMLLAIVLNFFFGCLVGREGADGKSKKRALVCAIALDVLLLGFFKYADFLLASLAGIPGLDFIKPLGIPLPIGISFYIFQTMSYVIDVYRGSVRAQRSFVSFGAYVTMFPQLIAGPIVRYSDIARELEDRGMTLAESADGARRFIIGLSKKVLLADASGALWEQISATPRSESSVLLLWLGIIFYSFQIYFDFSGYSDMAIGLGKLIGFHFPENFNYPYMAQSITDFWRRWHITLSSWFREYVYIPLGGNRRGRGRMLLNLLAVWFLTGLWHGASWNFILWGFYYFVLLVLEKLFLGKLLKKAPRAIGHLYSLVLVVFGWLIFYFKSSVGGIGALGAYLLGMLGSDGIPLVNELFYYTAARCAILLVLLALGSTPYPKRLFESARAKIKSDKGAAALAFVSNTVLTALFVLCIAYISSSEYRPNIYFEF